MIIAKNVSKAYFSTPILHEVDFKMGNNRKIGVVGRNGCGKTTMFKLVTGMEQPTSGTIEYENEIIGYIPQEFDFPDEMVGEYFEKMLEHDWEFYKVDMLVDQLDFENFDPYQKISTLSEGQKMKLKLIETMLSEPTTLFIDEPTNHLDIEGILWFERYIKRLDKTVVMISHDRSFLNHTVDEIWEIEKAKIIRIVGNYDTYKEEKLRLINKWDEEYVRFLRKKAQLEKLLDNVRKMKGGKRGNAVKAAKKRIEREVNENIKEKYVVKKMKGVEFDTDIREGKLMVKFDNVTKSYGDNVVFENLDFEIRGKEKIWLFGPNGAGKSTLVKLIMGDEAPVSGEVRIGENIKVGYFAQKQTHLPMNTRVMDYFIETTGCPFAKCFGELKKFLFENEALSKEIRSLSPGEKARLSFAVFAYNDYDLLVLDEPTNHLDIDTKEVIEKSLAQFKGTLLLVSHDRYFVESVGVDKVLNLKEGRLDSY
jgi:ATPase subunit of ABC transporter with duplicated ATPase domains